MGIPVLVLGESGSGKTSSLSGFAPNEITIFSVAGKPLPFKRQLPTIQNATYELIGRTLQKNPTKSYAIDDSQYLLAFDFFARAKERGYDKFTELALRFYNMLKYIVQSLPQDRIVYLLHHTELTADGKTKAKTVGRMLDEKLTIEGLFTIVLLCVADGTEHKFITQSDGTNPAKAPRDMLPPEMDNDLKAVDDAIRNYYQI
jgi:hypothetical protein